MCKYMYVYYYIIGNYCARRRRVCTIKYVSDSNALIFFFTVFFIYFFCFRILPIIFILKSLKCLGETAYGNVTYGAVIFSPLGTRKNAAPIYFFFQGSSDFERIKIINSLNLAEIVRISVYTYNFYRLLDVVYFRIARNHDDKIMFLKCNCNNFFTHPLLWFQ